VETFESFATRALHCQRVWYSDAGSAAYHHLLNSTALSLVIAAPIRLPSTRSQILSVLRLTKPPSCRLDSQTPHKAAGPRNQLQSALPGCLRRALRYQRHRGSSTAILTRAESSL